jgi:hypothetical protein
MPGPSASYSAAPPQTTRAALFGFALVAVLLTLAAGLGAGPAPAGAATLEPCEATQPTGPTIELEGELSLAPVKATRKAWKRSGIRQKLVKPANNLTGRPSYPVKAVKYGAAARVDLKGGSKLVRKGRSVAVGGLSVVSAAGKPARLRAKVGGTKIDFLVVKGGKREFKPESGELSRVGQARLTAKAAKLINLRLRLTKRHRLKAKTVWGYFNLYALYTVTETEDPTVDVPPVPPVKTEPSGAMSISSAATIKWFVRDSFINYVASGEGTRVADGATADPSSGSNNLVYSFNFPFASGWTKPEALDRPEDTLVKGTGTVGFAYCEHGINFIVSNPEVEIGDDTNSRLIFEVTGTDNSEIATQRAVVTKLLPSQAESHTVIDNGDGTVTVHYEKIPGVIPDEAKGIFADFYQPGDPFGSFSLTYTFTNGSA